MIEFKFLHPKAARDHLGFLQEFLDQDDSRCAKDQLHANYQHGGGWDPLPGWIFNPVDRTITYPDDPPLHPIAVAFLRGERIYLYDHAWVAVVQPDGSVEVSRMD